MPMDNDFTWIYEDNNEITKYNPVTSYINYFDTLSFEEKTNIINRTLRKQLRNIIPIRKKWVDFLEDELRSFYKSWNDTYISTDQFPEVVQKVMEHLRTQSEKYTKIWSIRHTWEKTIQNTWKKIVRYTQKKAIKLLQRKAA